MRVIVTGSRAWPDRKAVFWALRDVWQEQGAFHLMHGDCSTGADAMAQEWFELVGERDGCTVERFPADWGHRGKAAGPERNRRMIAAGADLVLAFPLPEGSGTQGTIKLAELAGIPVRVVTP